MILRKDAGAGRAGAASLPTRRNLSAAPSAGEEATRQRAIRRARRSARGFRGRTRRAVLSPVAQPPGEDYGRGRKGAHTSALDVERAEIPGNAASCFPSHMRNSRRVALCGVSHSRKVESEATRQRGELSSPICGTAAARICRDGAYRLMEGRFRGTR